MGCESLLNLRGCGFKEFIPVGVTRCALGNRVDPEWLGGMQYSVSRDAEAASHRCPVSTNHGCGGGSLSQVTPSAGHGGGRGSP